MKNFDKRVNHSHYKLTWTFAFFEHDDPEKWQKFKKLYNKTFFDGRINKHSISCWPFEKNRIKWIEDFLPNGFSVKFLFVTDKQFGDIEHFIKR